MLSKDKRLQRTGCLLKHFFPSCVQTARIFWLVGTGSACAQFLLPQQMATVHWPKKEGAIKELQVAAVLE